MEVLPYERYLVVMNYYKEIIENSSSESSINHVEWIDDYPKRDIDFYMIKESKYILWENNSDLLDSEYEEVKDELFPYG